MPASGRGQIPGPRSVPLFGSMLGQNVRHLPEVLFRWMQKYGPIFQFRLGSFDYVVVTDRDAIKQVFKDPDGVTGRPKQLKLTTAFFGTRSILLTEGEDWKASRRFLGRFMGGKHLDKLNPMIMERLELFFRDLDQAADTGQPADMKALTFRLAFDVNGLFSFGRDLNSQSGKGEYDDCLDAFWSHLMYRLAVPEPWNNLLPMPGARRARQALETLEDLMQSILRDKEAMSDEQLREATDPISAMILAIREGTEKFPRSEVRDQCYSLLNGGTDTNASMFSWLFHHLSQNPDVQDRIVAEVDRLGDFTAPDSEQLKQLEFSEAVARESMRLCPPTSFTVRSFRAPTQILGYDIPAGHEVLIPIHAVQHHPDFWENAGEFQPDRWLNGTDFHPYQYLVFGGGERKCPGSLISYNMAKLVLSLTCRRYRFRAIPGHRVESETGLIYQVKGELPMLVERR